MVKGELHPFLACSGVEADFVMDGVSVQVPPPLVLTQGTTATDRRRRYRLLHRRAELENSQSSPAPLVSLAEHI